MLLCSISTSSNHLVDAGVSYEDRVARRKEEIESLQQALEILNGKDRSEEHTSELQSP